jgi:hypothetical protein
VWGRGCNAIRRVGTGCLCEVLVAQVLPGHVTHPLRRSSGIGTKRRSLSTRFPFMRSSSHRHGHTPPKIRPASVRSDTAAHDLAVPAVVPDGPWRCTRGGSISCRTTSSVMAQVVESGRAIVAGQCLRGAPTAARSVPVSADNPNCTHERGRYRWTSGRLGIAVAADATAEPWKSTAPRGPTVPPAIRPRHRSPSRVRVGSPAQLTAAPGTSVRSLDSRCASLTGGSCEPGRPRTDDLPFQEPRAWDCRGRRGVTAW